MAFASCGVAAQSSPWYLFGQVAVTNDDNLLRLSDGVEPLPGLSKSDTSTSTALVGGFDRLFGRQRLAADVTLRDTRYASNERYDNQGWNGSLRLNWDALGGFSGQLSATTAQTASDFNTDQLGLLTENNDERVDSLGAVVAWGRGGPWRVELSGSALKRRNSLDTPLVLARNLDQRVAGLGLVWRRADRLEARLGVQQLEARFPTFRRVGDGFEGDAYDQRAVQGSLRWRVGGATWLDVRLATDEIRYDSGSLRDSDGTDGSIGLDWRPTGKLRLLLRAALDRETDSYPSQILTFFGPVPLVIGDERERRTATAIVEWQASAKLFAGLTLQHIDRDLVRRTLFAFDGSLFSEVPEPARTTVVGLEGRWSPQRWLRLGCNLRVEDRRAPGPFTGNLGSTRFGCSVQVALQ